jgi:hypothetical protein
VDKYFIDFAHPLKKIAIECDGKDFHLNKEKDQIRSRVLRDLGWTIYRISGSDCKRVPGNEYFDYDEQQGPERWEELRTEFYTKTIEGLLRAISVVHLGINKPGDDCSDRDLWFYELDISLATQCLKNRIDN